MARKRMWPRGEDGPKEKMDPWGEDMLKKRWVLKMDYGQTEGELGEKTIP